MATSFSLPSSARYLVVVRYTDGSESPFKVFCDTIAEVRTAVRRSLRAMRLIARSAGREVHYAVSNDGVIYAAAVQNAARSGRRYLVASGAGMEMDVILLR